MTSSPHPLHDGSLDPLALLQRHGDGNDHRGIRLRLLWLRQQHPEARVRTKLVFRDDRTVVMSARVTLPNGGEGAGHAASPIQDAAVFAEALEAAELRAIGRALDMLGYIVVDPRTEASAPSQEPIPVASPPTERQQPEGDAAPAEPPPEVQPHRRPPEHVQAIRALRDRHTMPPAEASPDPSDSEPNQPAPDIAQAPVAPPHGEATGSARDQLKAPPQPDAPPPPDSPDAEPELEDISWTAFWTWARNTHQIGSRVQVEELLGQPVARKTPGELRQLLNAHFVGRNVADS